MRTIHRRYAFVTWDEWAIVSDMVTALPVSGDATYTTAQTALLTCMNAGRAADDQFASFDDILSDYTGDTKTKMEEGGTCASQAATMFSTLRI